MSNDQQQPTNPDAYNGWTNYETWSVHLWLSNDPYTDTTAREIVATAWNNAADEIAVDRTAIVAPRADAADALREWLRDEENPLGESSNLYGDLLEHALGRVDWLELAEAFAPDPRPSLEPPSDDASDEGEEEEEENDPDADGAATTDPADIEPGYLSADDMERLRRARGGRRFFH